MTDNKFIKALIIIALVACTVYVAAINDIEQYNEAAADDFQWEQKLNQQFDVEIPEGRTPEQIRLPF